jgi:flavin reductase (DIM6/NTAB) family NADH-FMN oxidoreductase RutF
MTVPLEVGAEAFREVMAGLAAGVAVVTTVDDAGAPRGLTTTAIASVSIDPPMLLVCVGRGSRTLSALLSAQRFAVNLLRRDAESVAIRFASREEDKFDSLDWTPAADGSPLLQTHALAWAACRTVREVDAGDHVVFLGHVVEAGAEGDHKPLAYFRRRFGTFAPTGG